MGGICWMRMGWGIEPNALSGFDRFGASGGDIYYEFER